MAIVPHRHLTARPNHTCPELQDLPAKILTGNRFALARLAPLVFVHEDMAEAAAEPLRNARFSAYCYRARKNNEKRPATEVRFMTACDPIIVATVNFGMGVDKGNIRYVYHFSVPKDPENYSQQIGRAGWDGEPATCGFLLCPEDILATENAIYGDTPSHAGGARPRSPGPRQP